MYFHFSKISFLSVFDSFSNNQTPKHKFPYISAMIGDGFKSYEKGNDGSNTEIAGCSEDFRGKGKKVKVKYVKGKFLEVYNNF